MGADTTYHGLAIGGSGWFPAERAAARAPSAWRIPDGVSSVCKLDRSDVHREDGELREKERTGGRTEEGNERKTTREGKETTLYLQICTWA